MKSLNIMLLHLSLLHIFIKGIASGSFYSEEISVSRQELACCEGVEVLSCQPVAINITSLGKEELDLQILDEKLEFQGMVGASINSYHYQSKDADVVITVHNGDVYGHASLNSGESYVIEYCGDGVHVVKKLDVENLGDSVGVDFENDDTISTRTNTPIMVSSDRSTIVTYTVKVYYTKQFAAVTADIEGFIEQVIEETNQGYINSNVPLRAKAVCSEEATIDEGLNGSSMLSAFRAMKGTTTALRGSADTTALLVNSFNYCGIAYTNTISSGNTVSVTKKSCALGYFSFGHEIGHNIGLNHNTQVSTNQAYVYGHGHLIQKGSASTGYRTILAYYASGHGTRVNYYSNPNVNYPVTGTSTGVAGISDNAKLLTQNRFSLAAVGDESECADTTGPTNCVLNGVTISTSLLGKGVMTRLECFGLCSLTVNCLSWFHGKSNSQCLLTTYSTLPSDFAGTDFSNRCCHLDTTCISENTLLFGVTNLQTIQTSDAASCHTNCKTKQDCVQWQWKQNSCELFKRKEWSSDFYDSGTKYCS